MRLSRFTDYSLRVLIYLGQNDQDRVTINQISEEYDISKNHLMKVVSNLTRLKFVSAQRGPGGGIRLNHKPGNISLSDVIRNTEKHLGSVDDVAKPDDQTEVEADARLEGYLHKALQAYLEALGRFTLEDVLTSQADSVPLLNLKEEAA